MAGCGQCGGSGCGSIDGYTADECCEGNIESSGVLCEDSEEAPCIIDSCEPLIFLGQRVCFCVKSTIFSTNRFP